MSTYAGTNCASAPQDGPRLSAALVPHYLALGPGGRLYFAHGGMGHVGYIDADQVVTLAGFHDGWNDGPLAEAGLRPTTGLAVAGDGTIYISDGGRVRVIHDGVIETVAGDHTEPGHVDGPGISARFEAVTGLSFDGTGALYIVEKTYLRKLENGIVTTVAGSGKIVSPPVNGSAVEASLTDGRAVALVGSRVYFADSVFLRVFENGSVVGLAGKYKVPTLADGPLADAVFSRITGLASFGEALYLSEGDIANGIRKMEGGVVRTLTSGAYGTMDGPLSEAQTAKPRGIAADAKGNLYFGDSDTCRVRYIEFGS